MEITSEKQKQWNEILVRILSAFIKICKQNGLRYYCAGGTAIGAVRHQGMIPWDDDVDVFMPRPDYDIFIDLCNHTDLGDFEMMTPHNNDKYPLYFSKFVDHHTTLVEDIHIPFVTGLYIDVFPLDGTSDDQQKALILKRKFAKWANRLNAISTRNSFAKYFSLLSTRKEWGRFAVKTLGFLFRKATRSYILRRMDGICASYSFDTSKNVVTYCGVYDSREIYPKAWIENAATLCFEGLSVDLPGEYDKYLRNFFGDYLQLPPVEQRTTIHSRTYFNLEEREDETVVLKKIHNNLK